MQMSLKKKKFGQYSNLIIIYNGPASSFNVDIFSGGAK